VFLRGWTATDPFAKLELGEDSFERSAETEVDTEVEKCLEDGNLDLGVAGCWPVVWVGNC
jgi:hypothetical protein